MNAEEIDKLVDETQKVAEDTLQIISITMEDADLPEVTAAAEALGMIMGAIEYAIATAQVARATGRLGQRPIDEKRWFMRMVSDIYDEVTSVSRS